VRCFFPNADKGHTQTGIPVSAAETINFQSIRSKEFFELIQGNGEIPGIEF